ncbi:MAG: hypothetical protein ACI9VS_004039, partial [Candidatus Binatia bacterium]
HRLPRKKISRHVLCARIEEAKLTQQNEVI